MTNVELTGVRSQQSDTVIYIVPRL